MMEVKHTESAELTIDITMIDKEFINLWCGYVLFAPIERINELVTLLEPHLDLPKVQEVMSSVNQRLA